MKRPSKTKTAGQLAAVTLALGAALAAEPVQAQTTPVLTNSFTAFPSVLSKEIKHVIIIFPENHSFDSLYGKFPGATGLDNAVYAAQYGRTNNTPYTVTASLATGLHALTAVATDNGGLSTTSAVVNVTISVANVPPSVAITNPPDNSVFGNTDTITIGASARDTDGSVTNVQFFDGLVSLGNRTTSPYSVSIGAFNFALGLHTVTAVASDNLGATYRELLSQLQLKQALGARLWEKN